MCIAGYSIQFGFNKVGVTVLSYSVEPYVNHPHESEDHLEQFRASLTEFEKQLVRTHDVIIIRGKLFCSFVQLVDTKRMPQCVKPVCAETIVSFTRSVDTSSGTTIGDQIDERFVTEPAWLQIN